MDKDINRNRILIFCLNTDKALWVNHKALIYKSGGDLLSRDVSVQVSPALRSLTTVFGMGTGVSFSLLPPEICNLFWYIPSKIYNVSPQDQKLSHSLSLHFRTLLLLLGVGFPSSNFQPLTSNLVKPSTY